MIDRPFSSLIFSPAFGRQMRFVAGPRQCGKTTLAQRQLKEEKSEALYYNWDQPAVRNRYRQDPDFLREDLEKYGERKGKVWVCFDEIHKRAKWKNILKGIFDDLEKKVQFIVTGSARLDAFRRAGDSLIGRYFLFRLMPLSLFEVVRRKKGELQKPLENASAWVEKKIDESKDSFEIMQGLLRLSGFPEPFLRGTENYLQKWKDVYLDRLIREDLRDITKIAELDPIADLAHLLPSKVGSPLSVASLTRDLELGHKALKNYLKKLELVYLILQIPPYSRRIQRGIKKEKKIYFYDWTWVKDESGRFENYVAVELNTLTAMWTDAGWGHYRLCYVKERDGKESDFLILKEEKPWLLVEAKMQDQPIAAHHRRFAHIFEDIPVVQLCQEKGVLRKEGKAVYRISASRFFAA
jgi:hypothetical protein